MGRRLIESLSGLGAIHAAELLLREVHYELSVWSDDQPSAPGHDKRVTSIDGHIDIAGIGEAVVLAGADTLMLTVEDGRRIAVQLTSTDGRFVAGGWSG